MATTFPKLIARALMTIGLVSVSPAVRETIKIPQATQNGNGRKQLSMVATGGASGYDPDKEFVGLEHPKYTAFDPTFQKDHNGVEIGEVQATLYEASVDGKSYRTHRYSSRVDLMEALKKSESWTSDLTNRMLPPAKLREASKVTRETQIDRAVVEVLERATCLMREGYTLDETRKKLREDDYFAADDTSTGGFGADYITGSAAVYGNGRNPDQEYIPLMGGPWAKQLYLHQYLDMHAKAFEAFNHNPWAHQLIMLTTYFTLGRGIDHTCNNIDLDEELREFTDRTDFYARFENMMTDCWWSGEMFIEWYDNDGERGRTDFRTADPSTIWEIVTDPEDIRKVYYYHQQYSTPMQMYTKPNMPQLRYIIRQIPADQISHFKLNVSEYEKRGRTDLFSILGWAKRLKDLMNAHVIKGILEGAFCWDITVSSGDNDVTALGLQMPDPFSPGSTFVHTNAVKLEAKSAGISGSNITPMIDSLSNALAVGTGQPKEFIGMSARGARAGVLTAVEPGTKRYESRQQFEMRIAYVVFDRVIKNLADSGLVNIDDVLRDARTVKRLETTEAQLPNRDDVKDEVETAQEEQQEQQQEATDKQAQQQQDMLGKQSDQQHELALNQQKNDHRQALASAKNTNVTRKETVTSRESLTEGGALVGQNTNIKGRAPLNSKQKKRIDAIKKSGKYARELLEFSFPSIAQEDRSAKLKDIALMEAMEWLPKSISATLAAKELGISTYDFYEMWGMMVIEAKAGMSIAHVYGQDNKHNPDVVNAQSVQEELTAKIPPTAPPIINVPTPPAVAGFKQEPNPSAQGNGVPPGQKPNSGSTKVNEHSAPDAPNPTSPSHGYSKAGNNPMANEGAARIRQKEADVLRRAMYTVILKEAMQPLLQIRTGLARYVLSNPHAVKEFEDAVDSTEDMRTSDDA